MLSSDLPHKREDKFALGELSDDERRRSSRLPYMTSGRIELADEKPATATPRGQSRTIDSGARAAGGVSDKGRASTGAPPARAAASPASIPSSASSAIDLRIRNISLGGVGFRATGPLRTGANYALHMGGAVTWMNLTSTFRVTWCKPRSDGSYEGGGQFC
jgi:hypothetical protein